MDIFTYPHNRRYNPAAPMIELEMSHAGRLQPAIRFSALVDSGADVTFVPETYLTQINARYAGQARVRSFLGERQFASVYQVRLQIGSFILDPVRVVTLPELTEALIGRDVLNHLIVTLNGLAQVTEVSG